ncbi:hypothetical protein Tco_0809325, partial [Tanacetum coccineum]
HLDAKKKFVMYPRFISIFLDKQLMNVPVPLDHFPVNALTSKVFSFMVKKGKHFSGKVTPLFASMLVQPTEDEGATSERPSEPQPTPSPPHPSEANVEPQSNPSLGPSPSTHIPDSIPESSGGNHGGQSSSDKSLSGNEGDMTLQSVYDLCISLCTQVTDQAKEIKHLKAQIKKLKKKAKPVITHHRAWMKSVSLKQRLAGKKSLKKNWMQKESVSKQGRKSAKAEPSVHKDPLFDELDDDEIDNMETEDAQGMGRTRYVVHEEKERKEKEVSTEDVVSTDKEKDSTDKEIDSTDKEKDSTNKQKDSTDRPDEGTVDQTEGRTKAISREKEKGVKLKDVEETERPRPTSSRSLLTLKPLPKIDPKDKGKKKIVEKMSLIMNLRVFLIDEKKFKHFLGIRLASKERARFTVEERAKFLHDTIIAQGRFLAEQRAIAIRNKPPTRTQLRNQMMTYLKHVGNKKHSDLKNKTFEDIQDLYEKVKRVANETSKKEDTAKVHAKVDVTDQGTKKRKGGHIKMLAWKRKRPQSDVDSDDEHKKYLKIVTFKGTMDSEIMERKYVIARLNKVSSPDGDYLVIYRANRNFRAFNYLIAVERRYPLSKDLLQRMLNLGLEVERESTAALDLIRFIKQKLVKSDAINGDEKGKMATGKGNQISSWLKDLLLIKIGKLNDVDDDGKYSAYTISIHSQCFSIVNLYLYKLAITLSRLQRSVQFGTHKEALRNKAIMEGVIDDEDESSNERRKQWNVYDDTNHDHEYKMDHEVDER